MPELRHKRRRSRTPVSRSDPGQVGGGIQRPTGINVKDIASFSPASLPGLALWIKADPHFFTKATISEYIVAQPEAARARLEEVFGSGNGAEVIVAVRSDTPGEAQALVPLSDTLTRFPDFREVPKDLDVLDLSNYRDPTTGRERRIQLVSREPIDLPERFSSFTVSRGIQLDYVNTARRLVVSAPFVEQPPTEDLATPGLEGLPPIVQPTAELSQILVYSRELSKEEFQQVEGYLAYQRNRQEDLPTGHPYAPDTSDEPALATIHTALETVELPLKTALQDLEAAAARLADTPTAAGLSRVPAVKGSALESLQDLANLRRTLVRGSLYARKARSGAAADTPLPVEAIFEAVNTHALSPVPLSTQQIQAMIAQTSEDYKAVTALTKELAEARSEQTQLRASGTAAAATGAAKTAFQDEQREEHLTELQLQVRVREAAAARRAALKTLLTAGEAFLDLPAAALRDGLKRNVETFTLLLSRVQTKHEELIREIRSLEEAFRSKTWLAELKETDTGTTEEIRRGDAVLGFRYRDPYLNSVQEAFLNLRELVLEGDLAYLAWSTQQRLSVVERMAALARSGLLKPWYATTYMAVVRGHFDRVQALVALYDPLAETVTGRLEALQKLLGAMRETGTVPSSPLQAQPLETGAWKKFTAERTIRPLRPADQRLTGYEWVETDAAGSPISPAGPLGDTGVEWVFPDWEFGWTYDPAARTYTVTTPYRDANGAAIVQQIRCLHEFPEGAPLPPGDRPVVQTHPLGAEELTLSPTDADHFHVVTASAPALPIRLPSFGLRRSQWFCIFNGSGAGGPAAAPAQPIQVSVPGIPDDLLLSISPGQATLFLFGEAGDTSGYAYGVRPLEPDRYPDDPVTGLPRSKVSTFVPELNTSIFVTQERVGSDEAGAASVRLRPVLDRDGSFVPAQPDKQGAVYDLDDAFQASPYTVRTLPPTALKDLVVHQSGTAVRRGTAATTTLRVALEPQTGLAVLVDGAGRPRIDEFGYAKCLRTPIYEIQGQAKVRGATGDLVCEFHPEPVRVQHPIDPNYSHQLLVRSTHVRPYQDALVRGYVFVNESKFPLLAPTGAYCLVPPEKLVQQVAGPFYTFVELGDTRHVLLVEPSNPLGIGPAGRRAEAMALEEVAARLAEFETVASARRSLGLLRVVMTYIESLEAVLRRNASLLLEFNPEETKSLRDDIAETETAIQAEKQTVQSYQDLVRQLEGTLQTGHLPREVKISVDLFELKLKEAANTCTDRYRIVEAALKDTIQILEGREKAIRGARTAIEEGRTLFPAALEAVQAASSTEQARRGATSVPELDQLYQDLLGKQDEFAKAQVPVEEFLATVPGYLSELPAWRKSLEGATQRLQAIRVDATHLRDRLATMTAPS